MTKKVTTGQRPSDLGLGQVAPIKGKIFIILQTCSSIHKHIKRNSKIQDFLLQTNCETRIITNDFRTILTHIKSDTILIFVRVYEINPKAEIAEELQKKLSCPLELINEKIQALKKLIPRIEDLLIEKINKNLMPAQLSNVA